MEDNEMTDQIVKTKGVADIVFVLDVSGSMDCIINELKKNIAKFVDVLLNNKQSNVNNVRLGLVTHDKGGKRDTYSVNFMYSASQFRYALMNAPSGIGEFGLPAVDRALDFPWREICRRYIVFISNASVEYTGTDPVFQNSKLSDLALKMSQMYVHFIGYNTMDCPSYSLLGKTPGSSYTVLPKKKLVGANMTDLLMGLAKTVSLGIDTQQIANTKRNLYNL